MGKDADSHPDCLHFWYRSELNTSRFESFFEGNLVKHKPQQIFGESLLLMSTSDNLPAAS